MRTLTLVVVGAMALAITACSQKTEDHAAATVNSAANDTAANASAAADTTAAAAAKADRKIDAAADAAAKQK